MVSGGVLSSGLCSVGVCLEWWSVLCGSVCCVVVCVEWWHVLSVAAS